jgi:hydroxymethylpyrimidine pyrophosphatase-like HAD family hydrolase
MRYLALATGFDGTLAKDGRCDERCVDALRSLSASGRKLILVTGRELRELLEIFPEARIFDYVVAENGAVMHRPATRESRILAQAPPEILLQELRRRHVTPLAVGSSIVKTAQENEAQVSDALRKLQLDFQLVTNPGALMMLPAGVNKASGVWAALKELGLSRHNLVAIGDGENDLALFKFAAHAAAVQNSDPLIRRIADQTTHGAYCDGFLELAHELVTTDLAAAIPRHRIMLGSAVQGAQQANLVPCRDSMVLHGPVGSGKAAICRCLLEQFLNHSYQCCVVGANLGGASHALPAQVLLFGDEREAPRLTEILSALEQPTASVAIDLAALAVQTRPLFTDALLLQLQALHDRLGRPHAVFIHQAHSFLAGSAATACTARLAEVTVVYASAEPQRLPARVLNEVQLVFNSATQAVTMRSEGGWASACSAFSSAGEESPAADAAALSGQCSG